MRINVSFCLEKALFVLPLLVFLKWTMPLSVHRVEGLYKAVTRIKFCFCSSCVLTKDLNKSTGFKNHRRPSVTSCIELEETLPIFNKWGKCMDNRCNRKGSNILLTGESTLSCYWRLQMAALQSDYSVSTYKKEYTLNLTEVCPKLVSQSEWTCVENSRYSRKDLKQRPI